MLQPFFEVRRYRGAVVSHSHDFHQVVLPLEGRLSMVVSGTEGHVSPDSVALVAAGEPHSFTGSKSNSFLVIDIPTRSWTATDTLGALVWERARRHPFVPVDAELLQLIRYLAERASVVSFAGRSPPMLALSCSAPSPRGSASASRERGRPVSAAWPVTWMRTWSGRLPWPIWHGSVT